MINLYHRGFLPADVNREELHRWPFIYLHGEAEAPDFKEDAPDIFMASVPLDTVDDGIFECQLHIDAKIMRVEAYIWSHAARVVFRKGVYTVEIPRRHGLVISTENVKDFEYAWNHYNQNSICI